MATRGIHRKEVLIMFKYDYSYLSVLTIIKDAADNTIVKTAALVALIDSYANKEAERILITNFSDSVAEEKQLNLLEHKLLNLFDALKFEQFKKENGTTFRFGTFFDSDGDPIFTIQGSEFYTEEGERYKELSEVPMGVVCSWWFNEYPHSFFIKMPHPRTGKPVVVPCDDVMPKTND